MNTFYGSENEQNSSPSLPKDKPRQTNEIEMDGRENIKGQDGERWMSTSRGGGLLLLITSVFRYCVCERMN